MVGSERLISAPQMLLGTNGALTHVRAAFRKLLGKAFGGTARIELGERFRNHA